MRLLLVAMWVGWLAYWAIAARGAKAAQWREPLAANWMHYALALAGTIVLVVPRATPALLAQPFLPRGPVESWLGVTITAFGLGIAIAARIALAGNWSAAVEIKEDHALIRSGPYRYVRHPIYSGILLAVLGSAIALDHWRAMLGLVLIFASLWIKSRHEENRLRQILPRLRRLCRRNGGANSLLILKDLSRLPIVYTHSDSGKSEKPVNPNIWCRLAFSGQNVVANLWIEAEDFQSVRRANP
jgi:protein-S-isoprenylcysteine O-methyltransferase Ste14